MTKPCTPGAPVKSFMKLRILLSSVWPNELRKYFFSDVMYEVKLVLFDSPVVGNNYSPGTLNCPTQRTAAYQQVLK